GPAVGRGDRHFGEPFDHADPLIRRRSRTEDEAARRYAPLEGVSGDAVELLRRQRSRPERAAQHFLQGSHFWRLPPCYCAAMTPPLRGVSPNHRIYCRRTATSLGLVARATTLRRARAYIGGRRIANERSDGLISRSPQAAHLRAFLSGGDHRRRIRRQPRDAVDGTGDADA